MPAPSFILKSSDVVADTPPEPRKEPFMEEKITLKNTRTRQPEPKVRVDVKEPAGSQRQGGSQCDAH